MSNRDQTPQAVVLTEKNKLVNIFVLCFSAFSSEFSYRNLERYLSMCHLLPEGDVFSLVADSRILNIWQQIQYKTHDKASKYGSGWSAVLMVQGLYHGCRKPLPVLLLDRLWLHWWEKAGKLCYTDEKKRVPLTAVSVLDLFIRGPWADTQVVNYRPRRKINSLPMWTLSYESTNRGQPFEARLFGLDICTIRKTKMCKQMFQGFVLFWMKVSSSCSGLF